MNRTDILVIWEDRALISAGVASMGTFPLGAIAVLVIPIFAPIPKAYAQLFSRVRNPRRHRHRRGLTRKPLRECGQPLR